MLTSRLLLVRIIVLLVFLVFCGRLVYLQLGRGRELLHASVKNHLRWVRIPAARGLIVDRKGRIFATNAPAISLWLVSGEVPRDGWDALCAQLTRLGVYTDVPTATAELAPCRRYPSYQPVRLCSDLPIELITRLEEELAFLPGVYIREEKNRRYPEGTCAAHILGFIRQIDPTELEARKDAGYRLGDRVGKAGVERAFENALCGIEGGDQVEVDANGRVLRTLSHVEPTRGLTVALTIDRDIQRAAEQALAGHVGSAVALDPATGDILALASAPSYDPNVMSGRLDRQTVKGLRASGAEFLRATCGKYPPGSVFKVVTATAALETNTVTSGASYYCDGNYHGIRCWKHDGHGALDLTGAIAHSCNVAFMKMAEGVGIAELNAMARRFGLGQPAGLGGVLPEEAGLIPDPAWARRVHKRVWQLGDTLQIGMGQSWLQLTPLQGARVVAVFANRGNLVHPRLIKAVGEVTHPAQATEPLYLKAVTIERVVTGLRAVVGEGTAKSLDPALRIAGKTGTAQNPGAEDHAWFIGFAPHDNPTIAVAVMVEHGGHGGATAAPIAETIIRAALHGPPPPVAAATPPNASNNGAAPSENSPGQGTN